MKDGNVGKTYVQELFSDDISKIVDVGGEGVQWDINIILEFRY
jgi:hypothetical protein